MGYYKRKTDGFLESWFNDPDKKPLIIKGARQIGKTETIRHFAAANYENVIEINFVESPIFRTILEDGYGADEVIKNISRIRPEIDFIPGKTILFLMRFRHIPTY